MGAHFSLTASAPAPVGKAWLLWPFAADSKTVLSAVGGLPAQAGSVLTPALAGLAGLAFLAAALSLFGLVVPSNGCLPRVGVGVAASGPLYVAFFGVNALLPLALDALIFWRAFVQHWTVAVARRLTDRVRANGARLSRTRG